MNSENNSSILYKTNLIIDLYLEFGDDLYFGENVTQLQHALQAAKLANEMQADDETTLAAFLHDIGHICEYDNKDIKTMDKFGVIDHEKSGADFLNKIGFSTKVCKLVASHVATKRFLTYKYPEYYNQLSEASKKTLEFQGGKMSKDEAENFMSDPLYDQYIQLREWDDMAKNEVPVEENLDVIKNLIFSHLE